LSTLSTATLLHATQTSVVLQCLLDPRCEENGMFRWMAQAVARCLRKTSTNLSSKNGKALTPAQFQRRAVDAVAEARPCGAVFEDVALVAFVARSGLRCGA
jgi:hypothetical protein